MRTKNRRTKKNRRTRNKRTIYGGGIRKARK